MDDVIFCVSEMIHVLRKAIENCYRDEIEIIEIACNDEIRNRMKKVGADFKIKRDYFGERYDRT